MSNETNFTRAESAHLNSILGKEIPVLDHGFIRVIDYMGNDESIVQAARTSYGKGTKQKNEDRGLIRYLVKHRHTSPLEMCEIKLHIKMPIFVARQWIRHRTANVNEYSARYSILDKEFYIPDLGYLVNGGGQSSVNKQGSGNELSISSASSFREWLLSSSENEYAKYSASLDNGVSRELARMGLSLNTYTQWYWKIDLHNLLHFLKLRCDKHAQFEIRVYADIIAEQIVKQWTPFAYEAWVDYVRDAFTLSKQQIALLKKMLSAVPENQLEKSYVRGVMSDREADELYDTLIKVQ